MSCSLECGMQLQPQDLVIQDKHLQTDSRLGTRVWHWRSCPHWVFMLNNIKSDKDLLVRGVYRNGLKDRKQMRMTLWKHHYIILSIYLSIYNTLCDLLYLLYFYILFCSLACLIYYSVILFFYLVICIFDWFTFSQVEKRIYAMKLC